MAERTAEWHAANDEVDALGRVATLVAQGVPSVEIFSAVGDEVGRLFGSDISAIVRFERDGTAAVMGVHGGPHAPGARVELEPGYVVASVRRAMRAARFDTDDPEAAGMPEVVRTLGIRSGLASPIVVDGKLWGAITLASLGRSLPPGTERQLAGFTELVATALANAQARDALSRLADEQAGLRRVATLVAQGASPDDLFSAVAEEVAAVIDIPVVGVHRYEADGTFTMLGIAGETSFTPGSRWPVELQVTTGARLPEPIEVAAYYVASEALANTAKHAQASRIDISLERRATGLLLEIRDDGVGGADLNGGSGLLGLSDRVEALGGSIRIQSQPGNGTSITVELPLEPDALRESSEST